MGKMANNYLHAITCRAQIVLMLHVWPSKTEIWLLRCRFIFKVQFQLDIAKVFLRNAILSPLNLRISMFSIPFCWLFTINSNVFYKIPKLLLAVTHWRHYRDSLRSKTPFICYRPTHMSSINNASKVCIIAIFVLKNFRCQNSNFFLYNI